MQNDDTSTPTGALEGPMSEQASKTGQQDHAAAALTTHELDVPCTPNPHGHAPRGPLAPGIETEPRRYSQMRMLRHGTLWWIEHERDWRALARDPGSASIDLHFIPKRGTPGLSDTEELIIAGERECPYFSLPLAILDPARLGEIELAVRRAAAALSWEAQDDELRREEDDERFAQAIDEVGLARIDEKFNQHPGRWHTGPWGEAFLDDGIAGAVMGLWRHGVRTRYSCQGEETGGLYIMGTGPMPQALLDAVRGAGFQHVDGRSGEPRARGDWTFWDTAPRWRARAWHQAARRLADDLAEGGLSALDRSGARYRPEDVPMPTLDEWLKEVREHVE